MDYEKKSYEESGCSKQVQIRPSNSDTTYRRKVAGNVNVENTLEVFVVCEELGSQMQKVEVAEDYESKSRTPTRGEVR